MDNIDLELPRAGQGEASHAKLGWHKVPEGLQGSQESGQGPSGRILRIYIFLIKGDMKHLVDEFGFDSYNGNIPCGLCRCDRKDVPWNDWRAQAIWKMRLWTSHADWLANHPKAHPIFHDPELGVTISMVLYDSLHVSDYHGVSAHAISSTITVLVRGPQLGSDGPAENLKTFWADVKDYQKSHQPHANTLHRLTPNMLWNQKAPYAHFPSLSGHVKAATTRNLVPSVHFVFQAHMDTSDPVHVKCELVLRHLTDFHDIVARNLKQLYYSDTDITAIQSAINGFVEHYNDLTWWAIRERQVLFNQVPKFHFFIHMGMQAQFSAVHLAYTYKEEDFVLVAVKNNVNVV